MRSSRRLVIGVGALVLGCGGAQDDPPSATAGGVASSGLTSAGSESGDGPAEGSGSATDGEGECSGDEDCPDGQGCTPFSHICAPPGGCGNDADCGLEGVTCQAGICMTGADCGDATFNITPVAPNVMILLDRSGTMDGIVEGTAQTRWDVAKDVVNATATEFDEEVRFGLATFSACLPGGCSPGEIEIPVTDGNAGAIGDFLAGANLGYLCDSGLPETSTGRSLEALLGNPQLQDPMRENAILLVTDGEESSGCTPTNGPTAAAELFGQDIPVRVFAVGFAFSGASLDEIATAGGTGQGYTADSQAELNAALTNILSGIAPCTFVLAEVPPDPNELYVFIDGDPAGVPMDPVNGYTYDPETNSVTLHGSYCDTVQNGDSVRVDVVYGCPNPPPEG